MSEAPLYLSNLSGLVVCNIHNSSCVLEPRNLCDVQPRLSPEAIDPSTNGTAVVERKIVSIN